MAYDVTAGLTDPANGAEAVVISSVDHAATHASKALYVGETGNVKVDMRGGQAVTFVGVVAGTVLPIRVTKVYKTGTNAASMVILW